MIQERVKSIFTDVLDISSFGMETALEELPDWDSVTQLKLMLALEEEFGFDLSPEELSALKSPADVVDRLARGRAVR